MSANPRPYSRGENVFPTNVGLLKSQLNIVEVIREYVPLRKSGAAYSGLCPFHREKTASLRVAENKQAWHCFGCGAGGDVVSFVMNIERLTFPEALTFLSARFQITGLKSSRATPHRPRFTSEQLAEAGLFVTGFTWALEEHLADLKALWLEDETAPECDRIQSITRLLQNIERFALHEAARFYYNYRKLANRPFVDQCVEDATNLSRKLAAALVGAGSTRGAL